MRTPILVAMVCAMLATAALGDVVYLKNGKTYEGKVTRQGDKIIIDVQIGAIEVDASEVIYIATAPVEPRATSPASQPGLITPLRPRKDLSPLERATRPEPLVFLCMRSLAASSSTNVGDELRQQIEQYRAMCHDRKRKGEADWIGPGDFLRRRQVFAAHLKEARDLVRQANSNRVPTPKQTAAEALAQRRKLEVLAFGKMQQAARAWADPLLQRFLLGVAEVEWRDPKQAEELFRSCIDDLPLVAAFHQGLGLALQQSDRPLEALTEFIQMLELRPDSPDGLKLLKDAMAKVPGSQTKAPAYVSAEEFVKQWGESSGSGGIVAPGGLGGGFGGLGGKAGAGIAWLLPGKPAAIKDETLPELPYDRLFTRQAVGVPIGDKTLMVDKAVLDDALELFVQIDAKTIVPASTRKVTSFGKIKEPPLVLVSVEGYGFTPAEADEKAKFAVGDKVTAYGLGLYESMGGAVRQAGGKIESVAAEGTLKLSVTLAPGEAAGPVVTSDGKLAGFLAGKTDVRAENGGPDAMIPLADAAALIKQAKKGSSYGGQNLYGRAVRKAPASRPATGRFFIVYALCGEKFEK